MSIKEGYTGDPVLLRAFLVFGLCCLAVLIFPARAQACCNSCPSNSCPVSFCEGFVCNCEQDELADETIPYYQIEFEETRRWMYEDVFMGTLLPAWMRMTEQLSVIAMQQVLYIGMALDAKTQLETQHIMMTRHAQAHKDYHPSERICEYATMTRSILATERRMSFARSVLSQRSLYRQLGTSDMSSADGSKSDYRSRLAQFQATYCDSRDFNASFGGTAGVCTGSSASRYNADIDYSRVIDFKNTLGVDFIDTNTGAASTAHLTDDEQDIFALWSNLYSHNVFYRPPRSQLEDDPVTYPHGSTARQALYLEARSIIAKRSVAENSLNAIVALKSEGSSKDQTGDPFDGNDTNARITAIPYMIEIMRQLDIADEDIEDIMGEFPSYYAQMEILTRRIYQTPAFYINLYDKPANVARIRVALRAIALMQDRDIFQSQLRTEAMVSVLLELGLEELQRDIESAITTLTGSN